MTDSHAYNGRRIVLASGSPRRRELLAAMGYEFTLCTPDVDERIDGEPRDQVRALARRKADAACALCPDSIVIAADTLVALDGRALGKPRDDADAAAMLRALSGRTHDVFTGLCVTDTATGRRALCVEGTAVRFRPLTEAEIAAYVATGEPRDKAGAYAIQGGAAAFVESCDGSYTNVIGLPTERLRTILDDMLG
ncbi:MAG: septum formation protein Maf [Clostridia bacterium]|nr:septum formation protein Maf [Clostridia bacterium]